MADTNEKKIDYKDIKILIVEDETLLLQALVDVFTEDGFTVLSAKDGQEGLEVALKEHPNVILLDIIMPKMDGMTMLRMLREGEWGRDTPVLILTNVDEHEKMKEATKNWAYDYLIKTNLQLEDVVKKVKERLGLK